MIVWMAGVAWAGPHALETDLDAHTTYVHEFHGFDQPVTCRIVDKRTGASTVPAGCGEPVVQGLFTAVEAEAGWMVLLHGSEGHGYADVFPYTPQTGTDRSRRLNVLLRPDGGIAVVGPTGPLLYGPCPWTVTPGPGGYSAEPTCTGPQDVPVPEVTRWDGQTLTPVGRGFPTPRAAVQAFFRAAHQQDRDVLKGCFSEEAPGEFAALRNGTVDARGLQSLSALVGADARIEAVQRKGDRALVAVHLAARNEVLTLVRDAVGWRILDF